MKTCASCQQVRPLTDFHANRLNDDGRSTRCHECQKDRQYKSRYGITMAEYRVMLDEQGGVCKICAKPPKTRQLNIDHDHETGRVRGLLCTPCNVGLGHLERPDWVEKAMAYLGV